jgi:hypothetical protein
MKILNSVEQALFDRPPLFSSAERKRASAKGAVGKRKAALGWYWWALP